MQEAVLRLSTVAVYNSPFTASKSPRKWSHPSPLVTADLDVHERIIPLPVDFSLFEPGNSMGLQQALGLPDGCVLWVGASQGAAGQVKGWDIFLHVVRANPDLPFVAVMKDRAPDSVPPNLRVYERLPHAELVKVMGACRVGLCTSKTESQHLAGIEMGACGLPIVAPPVGVYWKRQQDGVVLITDDVGAYSEGIRHAMRSLGHGFAGYSADIRNLWRKEFDRTVIRVAWTKLIEEVECSGRS